MRERRYDQEVKGKSQVKRGNLKSRHVEFGVCERRAKWALSRVRGSAGPAGAARPAPRGHGGVRKELWWVGGKVRKVSYIERR